MDLNPFVPNALFLYPENNRRPYDTLGTNGLMYKTLL